MGGECLAAGEDFVKDQAQGIDIATDGGFALAELFGGHVGGCAGGGVIGVAVDAAADAEIGNANLTPAVKHDVGGLEIAVEDALVMGGGEAGAQLAGDLDRLVARQAADAAEQGGEVFTVDEFHGDKLLALHLADVEDPADVGMGDLARKADLVVKTLKPGGIVFEGFGQEFQGDGLVEREVVGAVDLAHSPRAEEADNAVALGDHHAGFEPPLGGSRFGMTGGDAGDVRSMGAIFSGAVGAAWAFCR